VNVKILTLFFLSSIIWYFYFLLYSWIYTGFYSYICRGTRNWRKYWS